MTRFAEDYDSYKRNLDKSFKRSEERITTVDDENESKVNHSLSKSKSDGNIKSEQLNNNSNSRFDFKNNLLNLYQIDVNVDCNLKNINRSNPNSKIRQNIT